MILHLVCASRFGKRTWKSWLPHPQLMSIYATCCTFMPDLALQNPIRLTFAKCRRAHWDLSNFCYWHLHNTLGSSPSFRTNDVCSGPYGLDNSGFITTTMLCCTCGAKEDETLRISSMVCLFQSAWVGLRYCCSPILSPSKSMFNM